MRITVALDDDLIAKAQALTREMHASGLVREALKALIERESARRLVRLGGSETDLKAPPRRRPKLARDSGSGKFGNGKAPRSSPTDRME